MVRVGLKINKYYSKATDSVQGEHKGKVVNSDQQSEGKTSWKS